MRNSLLLAVAIGVLLPGCVGEMEGDVRVDAEAVVATFHLKADLQQALQAKECTDLHGVTGCTPYPNPLECETLVIQVRADGKTHADCRERDGSVLLQEVVSVTSIPFICRANRAMTCQTCMDLFGNTVLDNCRPRGTSLFRQAGSGWGALPPSSAFLEEPENPTAPAPPGTPSTPEPAPPSAGVCHHGKAIVLYAKELNKILAHEGLAFNWNPYSHPFPDPKSGQSFFNNSDKDLLLAASTSLSCQQYFESIKSKYKQCPNPGPNGVCYYCWGAGFGKTCKASRINVAALQAACGQIPAACDQLTWSAAIVMAYGTSNKDLFQNNKSAFLSGAPAPDGTPGVGGVGIGGGNQDLPQGWPGAAVPGAPQGQPQFPNWQGSPLVLDLAGDGVRPTSAARGVSFDLVGAGPLRTAWVQGDDALLVLDRNGNGTIDDGTELFGSISGGQPWEDGFQALAEFDGVARGGNGDGRIDHHDQIWSRLRLWRDADRSGTSEQSELVSLSQAGIRSLELRPKVVAGAIDTHGNDLRLRGTFTWKSGAVGTIVDVDFVTAR